jgi:hypothetical protein
VSTAVRISHNPPECRQYLDSRKSNRRDRTGWLGWEDSNSQMSLPKLAFEVWPEFPFILERLAIRDFSRLSCQRVTCTPVQSAMEYGAPIAPPSRSSHAREVASPDPRVRLLPPQPASTVSPIRLPAVQVLPTFPRMVLVSAMHITAGVYVNDNESGLIEDIDQWSSTSGAVSQKLQAS